MADTETKKERSQTSNGFVLVTGRSNPALASQIAKNLHRELQECVTVFADGEIRVKIPPNLRRRHVFIIQSISKPVNDYVMELVLMIDAAKRSSAKEITAVIPYYGYSRQDRKEMPHVPISSSVIANILVNAGADRIVTVDIHSEQQQGFVKVPWDNLYGSYSLVPAIQKHKLKNLVVAAPDKGGMTRAIGYAKRLGASDVALVYKERDLNVNNKSEALDMIGIVKDRDVLLVDDMIDTAGTIVNAASFLKKRGAGRVLVAATHGLFSKDALEKIDKSEIDKMIITDTIAHPENISKHPKVEIVSLAHLLSEAIRRIETGESISRDLIL